MKKSELFYGNYEDWRYVQKVGELLIFKDEELLFVAKKIKLHEQFYLVLKLGEHEFSNVVVGKIRISEFKGCNDINFFRLTSTEFMDMELDFYFYKALKLTENDQKIFRTILTDYVNFV